MLEHNKLGEGLPPAPHKFSRRFTDIQCIRMFSAGIIYELTLSILDISAHGHNRLLKHLKSLKVTKYGS